MRIGIFGGTFDPPHIGHQVLAADALDQLRLDCLYWVLTPFPPHKQGHDISPVSQRLALVQAAIEGESRFQLSRVDLDRPGPHYAVDSVRLLKDQKPGAAWVYLLGEDSLRDLPIWYHPQELVQLVSSFGVMRRPGVNINTVDLEEKLPGILKKVQFFETPLLDISSSEIRQRISADKPVRYLLSQAVFRIIQQNNYYKNLH